MPTLQYPKNPNIDAAFVVQDDGTKNRALMTAPQDISTLELPNNPNSTKGYVTVSGKKQRVILTADISGSGGSSLPDQTGHSGEYLTTDGTDASWAAVDALPTAGGTMTGDITFSKEGYDNEVVGNHNGYFRIGTSTTPGNNDLFVKTGTANQRSIAFGSGNGGHIGSSSAKFERTYTQKLNNGADVAIPTVAGAIALQESTMPTADAASVGVVVQYVGTTDANYTNGYFYKCVSDGGNPATYSWSQVSVQPAPNPLPSQTGNSGKFLTTDGTDASWSDKPLVNTATGGNSLTIAGNTQTWDQTINIGGGTSVSGFNVSGTTTIGSQATGYGSGSTNVGAFSKTGANNATAYGASSEANALASVALGYLAKATAQSAIQINASVSSTTNSDANTFKVANANGNFEIMSADGTVPHARLTNAVVSNSITIAVADWNSGTTCTKTVSGLTATSTVWVAPAGTSMSDYTSAGIYASAQAADSLTFTCTTTPTSAIDVVVTYC